MAARPRRTWPRRRAATPRAWRAAPRRAAGASRARHSARARRAPPPGSQGERRRARARARAGPAARQPVPAQVTHGKAEALEQRWPRPSRCCARRQRSAPTPSASGWFARCRLRRRRLSPPPSVHDRRRRADGSRADATQPTPGTRGPRRRRGAPRGCEARQEVVTGLPQRYHAKTVTTRRHAPRAACRRRCRRGARHAAVTACQSHPAGPTAASSMTPAARAAGGGIDRWTRQWLRRRMARRLRCRRCCTSARHSNVVVLVHRHERAARSPAERRGAQPRAVACRRATARALPTPAPRAGTPRTGWRLARHAARLGRRRGGRWRPTRRSARAARARRRLNVCSFAVRAVGLVRVAAALTRTPPPAPAHRGASRRSGRAAVRTTEGRRRRERRRRRRRRRGSPVRLARVVGVATVAPAARRGMPSYVAARAARRPAAPPSPSPHASSGALAPGRAAPPPAPRSSGRRRASAPRARHARQVPRAATRRRRGARARTSDTPRAVRRARSSTTPLSSTTKIINGPPAAREHARADAEERGLFTQQCIAGIAGRRLCTDMIDRRRRRRPARRPTSPRLARSAASGSRRRRGRLALCVDARVAEVVRRLVVHAQPLLPGLQRRSTATCRAAADRHAVPTARCAPTARRALQRPPQSQPRTTRTPRRRRRRRRRRPRGARALATGADLAVRSPSAVRRGAALPVSPSAAARCDLRRPPRAQLRHLGLPAGVPSVRAAVEAKSQKYSSKPGRTHAAQEPPLQIDAELSLPRRRALPQRAPAATARRRGAASSPRRRRPRPRRGRRGRTRRPNKWPGGLSPSPPPSPAPAAPPQPHICMLGICRAAAAALSSSTYRGRRRVGPARGHARQQAPAARSEATGSEERGVPETRQCGYRATPGYHAKTSCACRPQTAVKPRRGAGFWCHRRQAVMRSWVLAVLALALALPTAGRRYHDDRKHLHRHTSRSCAPTVMVSTHRPGREGREQVAEALRSSRR